jgi:oligoendopeptidase F
MFLKDKSLSKYHYFLKKVFEESKYLLSESEEKMINLLSTPSTSMWTDGVDKVLNKQEIKFKNELIPVSKAFGMLSNLKTRDRRSLNSLINKKLIEASDFCEAEINAVCTTKKISDELRGFKTPYQATVKSYENDEMVVENLVKIVTDNFKVAHRFYKIKAKLLKEKRLEYADRSASIGTINKNFSFKETVKLLSNTYKKLDEKYLEIFTNYLKNGHIDVYPKKGKIGTATCFGSYGLPVFILLNHTDNYNSVLAIGHEMGHAIHTEMSHSQPAIYADYTISVAETASTLFENFVFEEIYEKLSDKEKIVALHNRINDSIATIFRQISCFNFEKELHETIRKDGYCAKEDIAKIMNKHMKNYLGPLFDLTDEDGYFFVSWSHIRRFFYVYSYAYGCLISKALYYEYKKDKKFKDKIEQFLRAGGSKSPEDIFADIGINIRNPKFFENGVKAIEEDIIRLEKLVK